MNKSPETFLPIIGICLIYPSNLGTSEFRGREMATYSRTLGEAIGAILFAEQKQNEAKLDQNFLQVNC